MSDTARAQHTAIQTLAEGLREALTPVENVVRLDQMDVTVKGLLLQQLQTILEKARAIRGALSAVDLGQETRSGDAVDMMRAWIWQKEGASTLLRVEREARSALNALVETGGPTARRVTVRQGETLQSLAAMHLGDYRRWVEIADANSLEPWAKLPDVLWIPEGS